MNDLDSRIAAAAPAIPDLSRLDLHDAQGELLAEITGPARPRRHGWLVAAVIVLIVGVTPVVLVGGRAGRDGSGPVADGSGYTAAALRSAADGPRLLLDAPGWRITYLGSDGQSYHRGPHDVLKKVPGGVDRVPRGQDLDVVWRPAGLYEMYRKHRNGVSSMSTMSLLGTTGQVLGYERGDYEILTPPAQGTFLEIRASGFPERMALARVLGQLRQTDAETWLRSLPSSVIVPTDDGAATTALLEGVPMPPGATTGDLSPTSAATFYPYAEHVTGAVVCRWIADYRSGDATERARAVSALGSSKDWRVLKRMDRQGDWPGVIWQIADEIGAGQLQSPADYHRSIGCPD